MTIIEALKALYGYPVPEDQLKVIALERGLNYAGTANKETLDSKEYQLAKADVLKWIAASPNVSEGGVAISMGNEERKTLLNTASAIYSRHEDDKAGSVTFGYKGEDL